MKKSIFIFIFSLVQCFAFAQEPESPTDFLSKEFHANRREAFRKLLPPKSVAVFFANPVRNRANDVDYHYHQDPDFYYLSGYREPNAVLLIFSEEQSNLQGEKYKELIFVQKRDPLKEQWNGKRLGKEGVKTNLGFTQVFEGADFAEFPIDYKSFDKILFQAFQNDVRNGDDTADLFDLILQFNSKTQTLPNLDTETIDEKLGSLREIKTPEELKLLRKAIDISAVGQIEMMKAMQPNMS
ncbi:MAG: aminopeptidase P family protein, partial [Bacteroidetes bacterium]